MAYLYIWIDNKTDSVYCTLYYSEMDNDKNKFIFTSESLDMLAKYSVPLDSILYTAMIRGKKPSDLVIFHNDYAFKIFNKKRKIFNTEVIPKSKAIILNYNKKSTSNSISYFALPYSFKELHRAVSALNKKEIHL